MGDYNIPSVVTQNPVHWPWLGFALAAIGIGLVTRIEFKAYLAMLVIEPVGSGRG